MNLMAILAGPGVCQKRGAVGCCIVLTRMHAPAAIAARSPQIKSTCEQPLQLISHPLGRFADCNSWFWCRATQMLQPGSLQSPSA